MATNAPKNGHGKTPSPAVYFLSLTVNNFRAFGSEPVILDLTNGQGSPAPWTILLGDNGAGKTTLLQSLAAVQPRSIGNTGRTPFMIGRQFDVTGWTFDSLPQVNENFKIEAICLIGSKRTVALPITGQPNRTEFYSSYNNLGGLICYGYGASRRMSRNAVAEGLDQDACQTLFDDTSDLINAEDWLIRADYAAKLGQERGDSLARTRLQQIIDILKEILPDVGGFEFGTDGDNGITPFIRAKTPSGWVRVANLSLGYKTTLAWIVDFAARMFDRYPKSENPLAEPAVCLVDEIDLHLHPRWQRKLIADLSKTFPKTQFIVTAHSPLIVQAAPDANLALLQWKGDHVEIDNDVDHIRKWRVDQILASELFGEQPTHAKEIEDLFDERTRLVQKRNLTGKEKERLAKLDKEIERLPTAAAPEDRGAMDIIRRAAALLEKEL